MNGTEPDFVDEEIIALVRAWFPNGDVAVRWYRTERIPSLGATPKAAVQTVNR